MLEEKITRIVLVKTEGNANHNLRYKRLDTKQFVNKKDIKILQVPPIIIIPDKKDKGCFFKKGYSPFEANAILLGAKVPEEIFYAASYCHLTEKIKV